MSDDPETIDRLARIETRICSIDGCDRTHKARSWCSGHYQRWKKYGDVGPADLSRLRPGAPCQVPDCEASSRSRGYCGVHRYRIKMHGDPLVVARPAGASNHRWTGDDASYTAVHLRLKKLRGPASAFPCPHCGEQARHWAYDNADPDEKSGPDGRGDEMFYSTDPAHYFPLCSSCHKKFDNVRKKVG